MTDRYAVIGNPIKHSKSPLIHSTFAKQTGQDIDYSIIEVPDDAFLEAANAFRQGGAFGMNVTTPFKLDAFEYADEMTEQARLAGAVNTLKFENGKVLAHNTDGTGLVNDIVRNLGCSVAGKRILLLGAGGAARGVILPFLEQKPAQLLIVNRSPGKAQKLIEQFSPYAECEFSYCVYPDLGSVSAKFDVVINATSASMHGELPPVHTNVFAAGCLAYELAYGKGMTPFLKLAQRAGAQRVADGVGMLVEQAAEAFVFWRGVRPETSAMITELTVPLV